MIHVPRQRRGGGTAGAHTGVETRPRAGSGLGFALVARANNGVQAVVLPIPVPRKQCSGSGRVPRRRTLRHRVSAA